MRDLSSAGLSLVRCVLEIARTLMCPQVILPLFLLSLSPPAPGRVGTLKVAVPWLLSKTAGPLYP